MKLLPYILILILILPAISASRLPTVGGDESTWGTVLNDYLARISGTNAISLNLTMVNGTNVYESSINTTHIVDESLTDTDISDITNLTLGEKITFTLGEVIDNIIDEWITITGNLNVTENIEVSNITADYYFGDGSELTGITGVNSTFNQSFTDTLYPNVQWDYNQTSVSTYNETYDLGINSTFNQSFTDTLYSSISGGSGNSLWGTNGTHVYNATALAFGIGIESPSSLFNIHKDSPSANEILFNISTGTADRFLVDEDGDTKLNGHLILNGANKYLEFTGTNGGGGEGVLYTSSAGSVRYGLWFPGSNEVRLSSRGVDGFVQIAANTGTGGSGGEVVVSKYEDDQITMNVGLDMTSNNITTVDCIHFASGGKICDSP